MLITEHLDLNKSLELSPEEAAESICGLERKPLYKKLVVPGLLYAAKSLW